MSDLLMKKIGIVVKRGHPQSTAIVKELTAWLHHKNKATLLIDPQKARRIPAVGMVIVLGGDGTLLSLARLIDGSGIPVLAVNIGSLGFLTEVTLDEMYPTLEKIFQDQYLEDARQTLQCVIRRGGKSSPQAAVLNEVAIGSSPNAKLIRMEITIDQQFVTSLRANGVIVATATGSTAYSLSAGGPIVHPAVEALLVTPISPHMLTQRPVLVPAGSKIEISVKMAEMEAVATFDGQRVVPLQPDDVIQIQAAKTRLKLICSPHRNYYQVLRQKLLWGEG
jgi:NAD+ kinase